jgi:hypothetical protein
VLLPPNQAVPRLIRTVRCHQKGSKDKGIKVTKHPIAFWIVVIILALSIILMLMGQTMAVFDYELAVHLGLQESVDQVSEFGVQINRAFGAGDTLVYVPLMLISLIGLFLRKRWSLLVTAAVAGVSAYWSITIIFTLLFLRGVPGYAYSSGLEIWLFVIAYAIIGVLGLFYLILRGDELLH